MPLRDYVPRSLARRGRLERPQADSRPLARGCYPPFSKPFQVRLCFLCFAQKTKGGRKVGKSVYVRYTVVFLRPEQWRISGSITAFSPFRHQIRQKISGKRRRQDLSCRQFGDTVSQEAGKPPRYRSVGVGVSAFSFGGEYDHVSSHTHIESRFRMICKESSSPLLTTR